MTDCLAFTVQANTLKAQQKQCGHIGQSLEKIARSTMFTELQCYKENYPNTTETRHFKNNIQHEDKIWGITQLVMTIMFSINS